MGLKPRGRHDRRHVTGKTRAEVTGKVRAMERRRDQGVTAASGRGPTLSEWLEHWLEQIAARRVRPRTLEGYRTTVRLHIVPSIGSQRLTKLQPEQVEAMYSHMLASGLSASSVLRTHRILSRALKGRHAALRAAAVRGARPEVVRRRPRSWDALDPT
ncbi:MAG: tyrosine-type recombinase/integrase, partial [Mycobacteriaceae bacterium]